jgi:hypothetical protein
MRVVGAHPYLPVGARLSCTDHINLYGGGLQTNPLSVSVELTLFKITIAEQEFTAINAHTRASSLISRLFSKFHFLAQLIESFSFAIPLSEEE